MKSLLLWLLIVVAVVLIAGARLWLGYAMRTRVAAVIKEAAVQSERKAAKTTGPLPKGPLFSRGETYAFLDAAKRAEALVDPLQRCLAYPDPPHSHWAHDAVVAYCNYRNQPIISFAEVKQLVQSGHAAELDRRFAQALDTQLTQPDAKGRLDRIFYADFHDGSFDIRPTLDAWKRQSPDSAFAYAASGYAYVQMAFAARGGKFMSKTPLSNVESMDRLAIEADADLKRAIALNPRITPAYSEMIALGGLTFGRDYALSAAKRGLDAVPGDWDIYDQLMWLDEPKWGGSLIAMKELAREAQTHASRNPLLKLLLPEEALYRADNCSCSGDVEFAAYSGALDQVASSGFLLDAGATGKDDGNPQMMAIYLSEALRFNPGLDDARINRVYALVEFDNAPWAIAEADHLLKASPGNEFAMKARAWAYLSINDLPHAQRDFLAATELDPSDMWALARLGGVYLDNGRQWDKAWDVANRLIDRDPQHVDGWLLRAGIQEYEPRSGLKETTDYIASHFRGNLRLNVVIARLQTAVAQRERAKSGPGKASASPN
ncbi:MAG TPA: hypothetical protein VFH71_08665 [Rhodanobacteraceae bacterium]|nr:hypothetical protein [Rhodanobacteraceae bacterium]